MKRIVVAMLFVGLMLCGGTSFAADECEPGLVAEFFDIGAELGDFPDLKDKKAKVKRVDKTINVDATGDAWPGTDLSEQFAIRWTGCVKIEKDGKYKFFLESDDGSRMLVNKQQVVDCNGLHAMEEKEGEVELKAGMVEIVVDYWENGGEAGCKLSWEGPGVTKQIIPESALFHKKGTEK